MQRKEALSKAHKFLKQADKIDSQSNSSSQFLQEQLEKNDDLNNMSMAHLIADIYQKGKKPRDIDFKTIDWQTSYANIRGQVQRKLKESGAEEFQENKESKQKNDMEKLEAQREKDKQALEKARQKASEEMDEMTPETDNKEKLLGARSQAWQGYMAGANNAREGLKSMQKTVEYAEGIIDIDEKLEEDFEGDFRDLENLKEQMQELIDRIEQVNFEASEINQSAVQEDEETESQDKEFTEDTVYEELQEIGGTETGKEDNPVETEFLVNTITEEYDVTEEQVEAEIEKLKRRGTAFEPMPGQLQILDEEPEYLQDRQTKLKPAKETDTENETRTFGNITVEAVRNDPENLTKVTNLSSARDYLRDKIGKESDEHLLGIYLDANNRVLGDYTISKGTVEGLEFDTRAIARTGILLNARALIIAHNHPGGNPESTEEDRKTTKELNTELEKFNIDLLDHIIVSQSDTYSMRRNSNIF